MSENCEQCKQNPVEIARNTCGTPTAKLIAIMTAHGVTDADELAAIIGIGERAIRKARPSSSGTTVPEPQFRPGTTVPQRNHSSGTTVPKTEPQFRGTDLATRAPKEFPTEIVIPKPSIVAQARDDAGRGCDLKILSEKIFAAAGPALACQSIAPGLAHMGVPEMWLDQGADLERDIVQTLQVAALKYRGKNIKSWDYFSGMVSDAKARRERGLPPARISTGPSNIVDYKPMPKPSRPPNYRFEDDAELVAEILRVNGECHA